MNKKIVFGILAGVAVLIAICITQIAPIQRRIFRENTDAVERVVLEFGEKMQNVSLQSPKEVVEKDLKENYSGLVTDELLARWMADFSLVPGKVASSPWPTGIRIQDIKKIDGDKYKVFGKVIEVTSIEEIQGGAASEYNVEMIIEKRNGEWLIAEYKNLGSFPSGEEKLQENINAFMEFEMDKNDDLIGDAFFCSNKLYGIDERYAYVWAVCSGFINNGKIEEGSGFSSPRRLEYRESDFAIINSKEPLDGSLYSQSVKELFPEELYKLLPPSNEDLDKLSQAIMNKAKIGFNIGEADESADAEQVLLEFFGYLKNKEYDKAVGLLEITENAIQECSMDEDDFDGCPNEHWDGLKTFSPQEDENSKAKVLENYASLKKEATLKANVLEVKKYSEGKYILTVQFLNNDGSILVEGPCCGVTEGGSTDKFEYKVKKIDGVFKVITAPWHRP